MKLCSHSVCVCVATESSSILTVRYPVSCLWCHYGRTPWGVNTGKMHWSQHHWDGLNMILACFFEPICLPLGVCASRLRLSPAGVTLGTEREAATLPAVLCIHLWTSGRKTPQISGHTSKDRILHWASWAQVIRKVTMVDLFLMLTRFLILDFFFIGCTLSWLKHGACGVFSICFNFFLSSLQPGIPPYHWANSLITWKTILRLHLCLVFVWVLIPFPTSLMTTVAFFYHCCCCWS